MKEKEFGAEELYLAPEPEIFAETEIKQEISHQTEFVEKRPPKASFEVDEISDLRESNKKVFRMSDGYEKAVFYPETLHVFDSNTKNFEKVDNSLIEEEDGRHIRNRSGAFVARFSKEIENDEIFSVEKGGHKITVLARKNKKNMNHGAIPKIRKQMLADLDANEIDMISFADIVDGSDVEYSVTGNGVKEDIVVKTKSAVYRYPFILECENVIAEYMEAEKMVAFKDPETNLEVFSIPAPFMTDAEGVVSTAVAYELKELAFGKYAFTVTADNDWINSEDRVLPVTIDPQILVQGSAYMSTYSWDNSSLYSSTIHKVGTSGNSNSSCNAKRMYLSFTMPTLPRNPRIKKAELNIKQSGGHCQDDTLPKIGLYHVTENIHTGNYAPVHSSDLIDFVQMKTGSGVSYTFDITTLIDKVNKGETGYSSFVLKMLDETNTYNNYVNLYGSSYSVVEYKPTISITYENTYGVNTSYRAHSHELGRFGQGSIDLQCGNLMFESEDFAWAGNRMPVTLKHLYNSALASYQYTKNSDIKLNTANFSPMKLGYGWRLNLMQSMISATFQHEGVSYSGYIYTDENGEETYFKLSTTKKVCDSSNNCYYVYEDVNGREIYYDQYKYELTIGSYLYLFDTEGRLIRVTDEYGNKMILTYSSNRLTSITDGSGREFGLSYNASGFLTAITAPDNTVISYAYTGNLLTGITYTDGKTASIIYTSNKPTSVVLKDIAGKAVYKVAYAFSGNQLTSVTEYGVDADGTFVTGASSSYSYSVAAGRTLVTTNEPKDVDGGETANNVITTTYTFDDNGNIVSKYVYSTDIGNVGGDGEGSGINPHSGDDGAGIVSNINNLLTDHNFESLTAWSEMSGNCSNLYISNYTYEPYAKFGKKVLRVQSYNTTCIDNGVYQITNTLPRGQYAFSAYLRVLSAFSGTNAGAFIRVIDTTGNVLGVSEHIAKYDSEYTRLIVPFEIATAQSVNVQILVNGKGAIYVDAAQLENNPYANAYNMLENGNFERGTSGWTCSSGVYFTTGTCFNMSKSLYMSGDISSDRYAYQTPAVRTTRSTRETFTLSGWAKGYGLPNHNREDITNTPRFRLRAVIKYYDTTYKEYGTDEFTADFSPCTEEWQFASVQFSKAKYRTIEYIRVYCDYGYNSGTVYFDDVQLVRNSLETSLSASDFVVESTGISDDAAAEATDISPAFSEAKDNFGNALTETTFTDGDFGTIYRSFKFNEDSNTDPYIDDSGNNLVEETDARGNKTSYMVNGDTSRNEEVIDRLGNKTAYEYDDSGRTTKVTSAKPQYDENGNKKTDINGNIIYDDIANVSYAYDTFDNMTEIVRGDGMKYALAYNEFHNLESIGIEGKDKKLIKYAYKNGNGRLKQTTYANGHTMKAVYNSIGQMVAEKWFETDAAAASSTATPIAHYKYVYDGDGNIVRSIDISGKKEYNYEYEEGRIVRATEADIELSGEIVTSKVIVSTIKYKYDSDGNLISKTSEDKSGIISSYSYEINETEDEVVRFKIGSSTVTSHSKTDKFLRKVFDELETGTTFVSRQFNYLAGAVTNQHQTSEKLKSTATTQLVSQIVFSDERTISYKYDAEDRIIHIDDSISGVVDYTYNDLNLLESETINGVTTKFIYDAYGNILVKGTVDENGNISEATKISYTYGDDVWKDLLTSYNGQDIEYDDQGNPTNYLGRILTWEKGRQLKRINNNVYAYNANGVRVSKNVNGVLHSFFLEGTKIVCEKWNGNVLIPLYDNEDIVCGIVYNNVPYYFHRNLQDDIIAIVDKAGNTVARYAYDAWGTCISATGTGEIASINPFRYRGYYCDIETGYYYLQTRYYDPVTGRFLNSDDVKYLGTTDCSIGFNLFSYCDNNPVNRSDVNGHSWISDRLKDVKNAAKKIAKAVSNTAQKVASTAKNVTTTVKNAVVNTAKKTATTVTNATKSLVTTVSGAAKDAVDWTKNKINDITKGVKSVATKAKEAVVEAWNWTTKKALPAVGNFFSETVWKKWIVGGVWETFCKDWVWETFCKDWVWETFCKDWVWETFCKKWVWQTIITGAFTKRRTINSIFNDIEDLLSPLSVSVERSNANLQHNTQIIANKDWFKSTDPLGKIIFNQGNAGQDDPKTAGCLLCGVGLDLGTNGCGYISIYNSGILLNKYMDLRSIIYWMEQNDGLLLKSAFGTNPFVMKRFLELMGISCDIYTDLSTFESKKEDGKFYIICQWNNKDDILDGAHFYAVECHNGKLYSYNGYHDCTLSINSTTGFYQKNYSTTNPNTFSSLMNYYSTTGAFICGLVLNK